ncbi:hypothetical protein [Helicobacter bilis]|uniref:hypothetical protein n=1 Tax=Helicobacter bilis TaxID=37372 RepID=UPI00248E8372|nr:hypothetical protein [Helicobacter bilis]
MQDMSYRNAKRACLCKYPLYKYRKTLHCIDFIRQIAFTSFNMACRFYKQLSKALFYRGFRI